jgi:hypothetical protein
MKTMVERSVQASRWATRLALSITIALLATAEIQVAAPSADAQAQVDTDELHPPMSGDLRRLIFRHPINKFDLRGAGVAQDLVVITYAENGAVSAPFFTMLLIHQDAGSGHEYILVDMPSNPLVGNFFTTDSSFASCFLINSSFFLKNDESGRHFVMVRAIRDRSYGRAKISIEAYVLSHLENPLSEPGESLYHFVRIAAVAIASDACTDRQLSHLEEKLLGVHITR